MDFKKLKEAKEMFEATKEFFGLMERKGWIDNSNIPSEEVFEVDVGKYICYLIASDMQISKEEVDVYRFLTGYGGDDIDSLKEFIESSDVMSYDFQARPPLSLRILISCVNEYLIQNPEQEEVVSMAIERYLFVFLIVGKEIIRSDESVTYKEKKDYETYISTLKQYIKEKAYVSLEGTLADLLDSIRDFL